MHMIEAVIKPDRLDSVKAALARLGKLGLTALECKAFGRRTGHMEYFRATQVQVEFVPRVLLKICVKSEDLRKAVGEIAQAAQTETTDNGSIFIYPIVEVTRIRTGERNELAI